MMIWLSPRLFPVKLYRIRLKLTYRSALQSFCQILVFIRLAVFIFISEKSGETSAAKANDVSSSLSHEKKEFGVPKFRLVT